MSRCNAHATRWCTGCPTTRQLLLKSSLSSFPCGSFTETVIHPAHNRPRRGAGALPVLAPCPSSFRQSPTTSQQSGIQNAPFDLRCLASIRTCQIPVASHAPNPDFKNPITAQPQPFSPRSGMRLVEQRAAVWRPRACTCTRDWPHEQPPRQQHLACLGHHLVADGSHRCRLVGGQVDFFLKNEYWALVAGHCLVSYGFGPRSPNGPNRIGE